MLSNRIASGIHEILVVAYLPRPAYSPNKALAKEGLLLVFYRIASETQDPSRRRPLAYSFLIELRLRPRTFLVAVHLPRPAQ